MTVLDRILEAKRREVETRKAAVPLREVQKAAEKAPSVRSLIRALAAETLTVKFGLAGMGIAPAGVVSPNTGHHHLLIDHVGTPAAGQPLPVSDQVRHFGGGQTQAELTLAPGTHTLQLMLGNYLHIPHDPPVASAVITITVAE